MKTRINKPNRGFTIIEVMIVLAIAGLILAIVFIAVPQLQRNTRDNQRQNVASRVKAELETYASNNQGRYPFSGAASGTATLADFTSRYYSTIEKKNPTTGNDYTVAFAAADGTTPSADQILIHRGASCSGESATGTGTSATTNKYALRMALDRSGTFYCLDNG